MNSTVYIAAPEADVDYNHTSAHLDAAKGNEAVRQYEFII